MGRDDRDSRSFSKGVAYSDQSEAKSRLQDFRSEKRRRNEPEDLPPGWERRESDIRPGQFYYTNPTTRQVALTIEEAQRDYQRKLEGDRDDGRKRKSAWDQREDEKDEA